MLTQITWERELCTNFRTCAKGVRISWNFLQGWDHWLTMLKKILPVPSWPSASRRLFWHSSLTLLALLALLCLCVPCGTDISSPAMPTTLLQKGLTPKGLDSPTVASLPTTHSGWTQPWLSSPQGDFHSKSALARSTSATVEAGSHSAALGASQTHQHAQSNGGTSSRTWHSPYTGDTLDFLSLVTWENCSFGPHRRHSTKIHLFNVET